MITESATSAEMIRRLVAFDTTSSKSNLALIDAVAGYLGDLGIDAEILGNDDGTKANLFATIGPDGEGGVCLSGHTDVVPVDGQPWETDPFTVDPRDGRLHGRGTADMKSFIAIALALVPDMKRRALQRPVHLALSYDEEIGCLGAPRMIAEFGRRLPRPELAIIGEPTEMKVVNANKGIVGVTTKVTGLEAHSSLHDHGVNAILHATRLLGYIEDLGARFKDHLDASFDPPHSTLNVGTIEGGTALNIIPRLCTFRWEFRPLPSLDFDGVIDDYKRFAATEVLPPMRRTFPEASIEIDVGIHVPPLAAEPDSPAEALARVLTGANRSGTVSFAAEAGLFQQAGIPAVICGPGSITQAHQPNEFITREQVVACETFLHRLIDRLCEQS